MERREAVLWLPDGENKARPVKVKLGLGNGIDVAVMSPDIKENDKVITGIAVQAPRSAQMGQGGTKNPFMPNMPKRRARGSAGQRERAAERAAQGGK